MPADTERARTKHRGPVQVGKDARAPSLTRPAPGEVKNTAPVFALQPAHACPTEEKGGRLASLLVADKNSSIVGVLDSTGSLKSPQFSPYGCCPALPSLLGFNGQRADSMTGHYPLGNGYRLFMPSLMRFNRPDSMSPFNAGGMNAYAYCRMDPVNWQDADGHMPTQPRWGAGGRLSSRPVKARSLPAQVLSYPTVEENFVSYDYTEAKKALRAKVKFTSERPSDVPHDYTLIAFHGSGRRHSKSLSAGIDPRRLKRGDYGAGFYTSPDLDVAVMFSRRYGVDRQVFGVYAKDVQKWREGVEYAYPRKGWLNILEPAYKKVVIRQDIKMPVRLLD